MGHGSAAAYGLGSNAAATAIKLSCSLDGGRSFTAPVTLQASDAAGDRGWAALALDASGTAHALWLDHHDLAARSGATAHAEHKQAAAHDGALMAQRSGLYYAASRGIPANENRSRSMTVAPLCILYWPRAAEAALLSRPRVRRSRH